MSGEAVKPDHNGRRVILVGRFIMRAAPAY